MAKPGGANFEIPVEMRALAEKSVEQARQAFDGFVSAAHQAVSTADRHAAGVRAGAQEMGNLAVRLAESNVAASFDFAQRLVRAQDTEEMLALQAEYVKSQMAKLNDQAKELSQQATKLVTPAA